MRFTKELQVPFYIEQDQFDLMKFYAERLDSIIDELASNNSKQQLTMLLDLGYREVVEETFGTFERIAGSIQKGEFVPSPPLTVEDVTRLAEWMVLITVKGRRVFDMPKANSPVVN